MFVSDNWSRISQKSLSLGFLRVSLDQHIFLNTFCSIKRRQNAVRDDFKLCKDCRECHYLQIDRNIYTNMKPYEYLNLKTISSAPQK